jgi:hypothetical protein
MRNERISSNSPQAAAATLSIEAYPIPANKKGQGT